MPETLSNAIRLASVRLMDAWKEKNFETLNDLLHKDFQFISAHVKNYRYNKLQWMDVAMNKYQLSNFHYNFLQLTVTDDTAICISKLKMISSASFVDQPNTYLVTDVWKKEIDAWKIMLRQPVLIF